MKYYLACTRYLGDIYSNQPSYSRLGHSFNFCPAEDALPKAVLQAIAKMGTNPAFHGTDSIFREPLMTAAKCSTCYEWFVEWKNKIASGPDFIGKFSTFI